MRIAAFISHPIQYFTPLWRELSARPEVTLEVFYFSRQGLESTVDEGFGQKFAWDIDLLEGHRHTFLTNFLGGEAPTDIRTRRINAGLRNALDEGWDVVFIAGYGFLNNWLLSYLSDRRDVPVLCFGDTTLITTRGRPLWKRVTKELLLRGLFSRIDAFLCAGGHSADYFQSYGAGPEQTFICPYVVDVDRWRNTVAAASAAELAELRERRGIPEGKRIVMFCGKLAPWKRPQDLISAVRKLGRDDVHVVFVGEGELRPRLEREGGELISITGFINQKEIPLVLSLGDVLVLPSQSEPYGLVAGEAQTLGIPAIVSDQCGCWGPGSTVQDGESGFVYPVADIDALAGHIGRLLSDDALHARMSRAAIARGDAQSPAAAAEGFLDAARFAIARRADTR